MQLGRLSHIGLPKPMISDSVAFYRDVMGAMLAPAVFKHYNDLVCAGADSMQTERVTFLTSREHKAALDAFASRRGESVGNVVREATARFLAQPTDDEEVELAALVEQVNLAVPRINASLKQMSKSIRDLRTDSDAFYRERGLDL